MGKTERRLTAATAALVFAAGLYVVIFAPFMVSANDDGSYYITDYSFTKGINEARITAKSFCAEDGRTASTLARKRTFNRATNQFGRKYVFTCNAP